MAVTPEKTANDDVVICTHQWSNENKPGGDSPWWWGAIAEEAGSRLIVVNTPGISTTFPGISEKHEGKLTPEQENELKKGSFKKVGAAVLTAALHTAEKMKWHENEWSVYGASMGAATGAGVVGSATEQGIPIKGAGFDEIVNLQNRPFVTLMMNFAKAGGPMANYLKQNPEPVQHSSESQGNANKRILQTLLPNFLYAQALAKNWWLKDLGEDYEKLAPIQFSIGQAASSEVTFGEPTEAAIEHLRSKNLKADYEIFKGHRIL